MRPRYALEMLADIQPLIPTKDLGEIASDNIRVHAEVQDLSLLTDQLDVAVETLNNLTDLHSRVKRHVLAGEAYDERSAKMLQIAYSAVCPASYRVHDVVTPSLEAFHGATKYAATNISLEAIGDALQKLAWKVADWIKTLWEKITSFIKRLFEGRAQEVKVKAENNKKELVELDHSAKPSTDYFGTGTVAQEDMEPGKEQEWLAYHALFGIKGRCDAHTTQEILSNTNTLIGINREIIVDILKCLEMITDDVPTEDELDNAATKLVEEIKGKMSRFTLLNKKIEGGENQFSYGHFHDSKVFRVREKIGRSEDDTHVRYFNVTMDVENIKDAPYRVKVLSIGEMGKISVDTMKLADAAEGLKNVMPIAERILHRATHQLQIYHHTVSDDEMRQSVQAGLNMVMDLFKYVGKHLPNLSAIALRTAEDATTYVRASIGKHKSA